MSRRPFNLSKLLDEVSEKISVCLLRQEVEIIITLLALKEDLFKNAIVLYY